MTSTDPTSDQTGTGAVLTASGIAALDEQVRARLREQVRADQRERERLLREHQRALLSLRLSGH